MQVFLNPLRGTGIPTDVPMARGVIRTDAAPVRQMLSACPVHAPTPLLDRPDLAAAHGVQAVRIKDERARMRIGSFKALGGAYAVAVAVQELAAQTLGRAVMPEELTSDAVRDAAASLHVICASAGNHGVSVAAGARVFGAKASIYLSRSVPEDFAERLAALGATVVRAGDIYEESLEAAKAAAATEGMLIADCTWPGYVEPALKVMEGYSVLAAESAEEMAAPTHIFLQAGVGGMASAVAATLRAHWGGVPKIIVVEPDAAPCLIDSVRAGKPITAQGPVSNMGRLDCKDTSHVALDLLAKEADAFVTISDTLAEETVAELARLGLDSSPSGAAGLIAFMKLDNAGREALGISAESRVWAVLSEGVI